MKKLAARNFEDSLQVCLRSHGCHCILTFERQCAIPVFDGLLSSPYNESVLTLLFRLAEWHALAKLRMHTDATLTYLDLATESLGRHLRLFCNITCPAFSTVDLPKEAAARSRSKKRNAAKATSITTNEHYGLDPIPVESSPDPTLQAAGSVSQPKARPRQRKFKLNTVKVHFLGDYARTIRMFGTTDSYSTQTVCPCFFAQYHLSNNTHKFIRVSLNTGESNDSIVKQTNDTP